MTTAQPAVLTNRRVAAIFMRFSLIFWRDGTALVAWSLSVGIFLVTLAMVWATVGINRWMAVFFDAIGSRDPAAIWRGLTVILGFGLLQAVATGLWNWMRMRIQIAWRERLTRELFNRWVAAGSHHHLLTTRGEVDSPEFRITEDVRLAIEPLVDFATSLVNCLIAAIAFITILWTVGGGIHLPLFGGVYVPGYMVWLAVLYAVMASGAIAWIGRPLIRANERKAATEAALRGDLVLLSEHADRGEMQSRLGDRQTVARDIKWLFANWRNVAFHQSKVASIISANVTFMPVVPLLAGAPKYLSHELSLGALVQLGAAFTQTQLAFNWLFDNYIRIAEWLANATRIVALLEGLAASERAPDVADAPD